MVPLANAFAASHTRVVFIGSSTPEQTIEYLKQTQAIHISGDFYSDPSVTLYKTFNLKRGVFRSLFKPLLSGFKTYGMKGIVEGIRLGVETSHLAGDSWQQGGTVLLDKDSNVLYLHQENDPADFPNMEQVLRLIGVMDHKVDYRRALADWLKMREESRTVQK